LRGIANVGKPRESSRQPGRGIPPVGECGPCAIARRVADHNTQRTAPYVAEDIDEQVVMFTAPEHDGLVVTPRQHVGGLEELPIPRRALVLAALRRAVRTVEARNPQSAGARVVVLTDLPASEGHVCFQVVPGEPVAASQPDIGHLILGHPSSEHFT
jgi:hypothetical protein